MDGNYGSLLLRIFVIISMFLKVKGYPRVRRETSIELWTDGMVPYIIPPAQFTEDQQKLVRVAMNRWEEITCIQFVPYTEELRQQMGAVRYIEFYQGATCFSSNGMVQNQPQTIGIGNSCMNLVSIAHELGHAIGLVHTMRRSDRDYYVTVHYDNVNLNSRLNFDTTNTSGFFYNLYGTSYDYKSIMHYKPKTWSVSRKTVLETKDPAYQSVIGRATKISFFDSMWVNRAYKCSENCDQGKQCHNGGYLGGSNCQCICPDGFMGYHCEAPIPGYQKIITWKCPDGWKFANGRCYRLYSKIYVAYEEALNLCINQKASHVTFETEVERDWVVRTLDELQFTKGTKSLWIGVKRNANDVWLGNDPFYQWLDGQAYNDSLMAIHDMGTTEEDNCGFTDGQSLTIGSCSRKSFRGFVCMKDFDTSCGGRFRLRNKVFYITSPGYPESYTNSMECQYVIQARRDKRVEVTFEVFGIEITDGCQDDYVLIQSSNSAVDEGKKYCGVGLWNKTVVSTGSLMIVTFKSDMRTSDVGFKAKIKAIPLRHGGRERENPADFLSSFYSVFSSNNEQTQRNSYLESAWNIFDSMSLSNILG